MRPLIYNTNCTNYIENSSLLDRGKHEEVIEKLEVQAKGQMVFRFWFFQMVLE